MHIFIVAGEPSGDFLGSRLMVAIRQRYGQDVTFSGIGGSYMAAQGLHSLFPLDELAVMGAIEVIPRLRRLLRCLNTLTFTISAELRQPDICRAPAGALQISPGPHGSTALLGLAYEPYR